MDKPADVGDSVLMIARGMRGLFLLVIAALVLFLLNQDEVGPKALAVGGLALSCHVAFMLRYVAEALRGLHQRLDALERGER